MRISNVCIKDICSIRSGKRLPKGSDFFDGITPYPYIRARDIKNGRINDEELVYLSAEVHEKIKQYIVNTNDVVITIVGASVGDVAIVPQKLDGYNLTENAVRLTDFSSDVNPKYILYVLNTKKYWEIMQQIAGGSAQPKLGIYKIESIQISLPDIRDQDKIVDILSTYDELIENNQKQIKLLEEAAQRLYKEWFIDLRFPGYETTPIHDGVPEGWFWGTVDEVIEYHDKKRKPLSSTERAQFQGNYKYYGAAGVLDHVKEYLFDGIFLLFGEDGTVITPDGYPVLQYVSGQFWVNNHAHVLTGKACYSTEYIYMMFKNIKVSDVVTGVAQPKISQARLSAKKILIPERELVLTYSEIIKPYMQMNLALQEQNEQLIEARDRLLPKLMNGEIEV